MACPNCGCPCGQGSSAHSFLSRPFSRSTAPRWRYSFFQRSEVRGIRVCSRLAVIHRLPGEQSAVGQRHLDACRLASAPQTSTRHARRRAGGACQP
jgi:hypothetical protein